MKSEDVEKVLEVMHQVKPDELSKDAKKLFNAIMQIADERDELLQRNMELLTFIQNQGMATEYGKWKRKNKLN